ncbi:translational activator of cytochrome c oxidase 1 [Fopius arisanus]|uniref:Translational activator of cytochrome c oxidase 1 n=1 Tax=Fopius arisanus TaxID=64838 RepID=A0A9R1SUG2_9HYME|nr:PREDICTED: translational activator of cytochrome c oxidase 1 [Fopius arisanus]
MYSFIKLCIRSPSVYSKNILRQEKRFAGHSKWQNIKHVKAEKDAEKSLLNASYVRKMQVAIAEGKSHKPIENLKLAQIMEEAKKKCVPAATIAGVLERAEKSKTKSRAELLDFRGPGGSIFVIKILSDNIPLIKNLLNTVFRKNNCVVGDEKLRNVFEHRGVVIAEIQKDLDGATDDAIAVGAEEVEEFENNGKFYKFYCNPVVIPKVVTKLQSLNYSVQSADEEFIPNVITTVDENDSKKIDNLYKKLNQFEEIVSINHNIDFSDEQQQAASRS